MSPAVRTQGGRSSARESNLTNPELKGLDSALGGALGAVLLTLADSELIIGHRHSEWTGFAPSAEEDVAFSSIAQDEMGHAHLYYALIAGAEEESVDRLALNRAPGSFRHLPICHAGNGDWFFSIARHFYWEIFEQVVLRALRNSSLPLLPNAAQRLLNEESYHRDHAEEWITLLASSKTTRTKLSTGLERVISLSGNPVDALSGWPALATAGATASVADLRSEFVIRYRSGLVRAGVDDGTIDRVRLALGAGPATKPRGIPGWSAVHRDLTALRRAHPGASW